MDCPRARARPFSASLVSFPYYSPHPPLAFQFQTSGVSELKLRFFLLHFPPARIPNLPPTITLNLQDLCVRDYKKEYLSPIFFPNILETFLPFSVQFPTPSLMLYAEPLPADALVMGKEIGSHCSPLFFGPDSPFPVPSRHPGLSKNLPSIAERTQLSLDGQLRPRFGPPWAA